MTDEQRWLSRRYLWYQFFTNTWYISAIWLYFYRLFINDQQVGFLDGMAFAIGLLAEVPSGALADKFGRGRIIRLGLLFAGGGLLLQGVASSFVPIFVGQSVLMIGLSLMSGADDALFFERLHFDRSSVAWRKLVTRGSQFGRIGSLIATLAGGLLQALNPRVPWILTSLSFIGAALLIWNIADAQPPAGRQRFLTEVGDYLQDIKAGFAAFRTPKLWLYVPIIVSLQGLFYVVGYGLLRVVLLSRFQFGPFASSVVLATCSIASILLLDAMHRSAERLSEKYIILTVGVAAVFALLYAVGNVGAWGYIVILLLTVGEQVLYPFMSEVLNKHAPENQRATVLSVASFFRMLPYVILAPLIGTLNLHGQLHYFLIGWAFLLTACLAVYLRAKRRDTRIPVTA